LFNNDSLLSPNVGSVLLFYESSLTWVNAHYFVDLRLFQIKRANARINAAAHNETSIQASRMKATLFPLAFNELLDSAVR
jgi:hypothetical protein